MAVFTGDMPSDFDILRQMMKTFVLPAIRSEGALARNPVALAKLEAEISRIP